MNPNEYNRTRCIRRVRTITDDLELIETPNHDDFTIRNAPFNNTHMHDERSTVRGRLCVTLKHALAIKYEFTLLRTTLVRQCRNNKKEKNCYQRNIGIRRTRIKKPTYDGLRVNSWR